MKMSEVPEIQFGFHRLESVEVISLTGLETLRLVSSNNNQYAYAEFKFWLSVFLLIRLFLFNNECHFNKFPFEGVLFFR